MQENYEYESPAPPDDEFQFDRLYAKCGGCVLKTQEINDSLPRPGEPISDLPSVGTTFVPQRVLDRRAENRRLNELDKQRAGTSTASQTEEAPSEA